MILAKLKTKTKIKFYQQRFRYFPTSGPKNAVFIWIPKNAGTSLLDVLRREAGFTRLKRMHEVTKKFNQQGRVTFGHISYQDLCRHGLVNKNFDQTAYKFCFVRDPYERAVSLYLYMSKDRRFNERLTFLQFCQKLSRELVDPIGLHHVSGFSQCNPQTHWLKDIHIDFMGRQENLQQDFKHLAETFGVASAVMPHLNQTQKDSFTTFYCPESKAIVEKFYQQDFEKLGYKIRVF